MIINLWLSFTQVSAFITIAPVIGPWYAITNDPKFFAFASSPVISDVEGGEWVGRLSSVVVVVVLQSKLPPFAWLASRSTICGTGRTALLPGIQEIIGHSVNVSHRVIIRSGISSSD